MTVSRVVALAQALAMIMILAPGPRALGPAPARAVTAPLPAGHPAQVIANVTGRGIGCETSATRYRGPREPGDPPWPLGAEPTPSPEPSPDPSAVPSASPVAGAVSTTFMAGTSLSVAQADPSPGPSSIPDLEALTEADGTDDGIAPDADLAPHVLTTPQTLTQGDEGLLIGGIDVSHHNGDIDYERIRDAGNEFVFIKATQDDDFIDPMFLTNVARARAAGLAAGGYHFFDYTLDGTSQADHFLDRLELAGAIDDALPPVVDVECWGPIGSSIHAVSTARLRDFVTRVYERTGRPPIIYTSVFMWKEVVGNAEGFEELPLWAACWGCDAPPSIASGWDDWTFWQTGVDRIPGVGSLDGNYFSGGSDDLEALRLRPLRIEAGAPATAHQQVELDLGGRVATHLRTSRDGQTWSAWSATNGTPRALLGAEEGPQTLHVQLRDGPARKSPVFVDTITLDQSGPQVSTPIVRLREAPLAADPVADPAADPAAAIPIEVAWEASDPEAGLSDAALSIACGTGRAAITAAPGSAELGVVRPWSVASTIPPATGCAITVIGRDGVGNPTRARAGTVEATLVPVTGTDSLSATVEGDQVAVVARRGPDAGRAAVLIDGEAHGLVDLYAPLPGEPELVYIADLASGATATISIEATGTSHPEATGDSVAIEGFVTLAAR
jgi:GH25 family lysozyme M1 (1,4-beta-N-acetylmuramidase)